MAFIYEEKKHDSPDFDKAFKDGPKAPILKTIFHSNGWKFILSLLVYIIKDSPIYVVPICTTNIINTAYDVITNKMSSADCWLPITINSIIIVFFLVQNLLTHTIYAKLTDNMLRNSSAGLREAVVRKLQHLSISHQQEMESGAIQSKFIRDIDNTENYLNTVVKALIPAILTATIAFGIAMYNNLWISLFFLLVIPLNVGVSQIFRNKIGQQSRQYRLANESLSKRFVSMIEMIPITKAHGLEDKEIHDLDAQVSEVRSKGLHFDFSIAIFGSSIWILGNLLSFSCVLFCVFLAMNGKIQIGDIVLFQSLFANINGSVASIVGLYPTLSVGREAISSLSELMTSEEIEDEKDKIHIEKLKGEVEFSHVYFSYSNNGKDAITDFSLHVDAGECVAFVGPSGSGKTTTLNLVIGLLKPTKGDILIDGTPMDKIALHDYRHHISVVSQTPILFKGSIKDNITYGLAHYTDEDVNNALHLANCDEFISQLPGGSDFVIEEHGSNLSGGQKQRITIARALIRDPQILIFDEATSALDTISEHHVQEAIASSISGRTTFIVAHRISTIQNADLIVYIENGVIQEQGNYDSLMEKKGKFYQMETIAEKNPINKDQPAH